MEVVPHMKRLPFQRREVQEWSRLDSVTGALETGRVESGRWAQSTSNSTHHFGQVVDLRARNRADGSKEQRRQKKQLEVFQANIPGGSVQVIRSQTTTSSWHGQSTSSSKLEGGMPFGWSHGMNNSSNQSKTSERTIDDFSSQTTRLDDKTSNGMLDTHFENLQLSIHPLDLSPQKSKASVGRSGSISGRRPPTRPRSIAGTGQGAGEGGGSRATSINEQQKKWQSSSVSSLVTKSSSHSESKSIFSSSDKGDISKPVSLFSITNNRKDVDFLPVGFEEEGTNKRRLFRMKSCSSEDIRLSPDSTNEDTNLKVGDEWRRDSLERRSLQLPPVQPKIGSDKRQTTLTNRFESQKTLRSSFLREDSKPKDIEKQTVIDKLKGNQWKSIEDILKKNVDNQLSNSRSSLDGLDESKPVEERLETRNSSKKRNSFVTVESLNEVRGRLRRTDSFTELIPGVDRSNENIGPVEQDNSVSSETQQSNNSVNYVEKSTSSDLKSVKSFVYGIETVLQGDRRTGSLETRGNNKAEGSNGLTSKTEEWYNRRKSYGFEPVRQQQQQSIANRHSLHANTNINLAESTDSGICRSSETVANTSTPWYNPTVSNKYLDGNESRKTSHTITIKNSFNYDNILSESKSTNRNESAGKGSVPKGKKTVVTVGNDDQDEGHDAWMKTSNKIDELENDSNKLTDTNTTNTLDNQLKDDVIVPRGKVADALRSLRQKSSLMNSFEAKRLSEPITISIPSPIEDESTGAKDFLLKQTKDPSDVDRYKLKKLMDGDTKNEQTSYSKLIFGESKIKVLSKSFDGQSDNEYDRNVTHNTSSSRFYLRPVSKMDHPEFKRHSIAVDETKYITNKNKNTYELPTTIDNSNFRLNSNNQTFTPPFLSKLKPADHEQTKIQDKGDLSGDNDSGDKKQKKVEFCKTEVHFAAEPGRFNIVETDGKPPSNLNFRRRRKTISESSLRNTSNLPEIRFGDLQYEKALLSQKSENLNGDNSQALQKEERMDMPSSLKNEVITVLPDVIVHPYTTNADDSDTKTFNTGLLDDDVDPDKKEPRTVEINTHDSLVKPRSILKNNVNYLVSDKNLKGNVDQLCVSPVNEKQQTTNYNQGIINLKANERQHLVQSTSLSNFKSSVRSGDLSNTDNLITHRTTTAIASSNVGKSRSDCEEQVESELQKLLKSLRPTPRKNLFLTDDELSDSSISYPQSSRCRTSMIEHNSSSMAADNGLAVHISSKSVPAWSRRSPNTTACALENIHRIDEYKSKGFSTRVNFGSEETMVLNNLETIKKGIPVEPVEYQLSSAYPSEPTLRAPIQPSSASDNFTGVQPDVNAVSTSTLIRFNAAPDLNHNTNMNNGPTASPSLKSSVENTSESDNISSASLVLKMLLNRAAQSKRRELKIQKSETGMRTNFVEVEDESLENMKKDQSSQVCKEDDLKLSGRYIDGNKFAGKNNDLGNRFNELSLSTEHRMMKIINSQHKQPMEVKNEVNNSYSLNSENCSSNKPGAQYDVDEREERLSRISNDSILEALENLSQQIENDIIDIPKVKTITSVKKEEPSSNIFKLIEDHQSSEVFSNGVFHSRRISENKRGICGRTDSVLSQSQLSDDTLQADEEVKSYMSAENEGKESSEEASDSDVQSNAKNCDRLTNFNHRSRRVVKTRTKEPCTSQFSQGIISQPKNNISDDVVKGQSSAKYFNATSNENSISDNSKSVETLVSTRSGHPRITSISLRYNDTHDTNGTSSESSLNSKKYSKNSICIDPCDRNSASSDVSSSWKWSKGSKQSVRTSTQNVSLSNVYSKVKAVDSASPKDDNKTCLVDETNRPASNYSNVDSEINQRRQVVKSSSDHCMVQSSGKPQFGKVTAVVPPTVAYSSSVVLNYSNVHQPIPSAHERQMNDNRNTHQATRSIQATSTNVELNRPEAIGVEKNKIVSDQKNAEKYRKTVQSTSGSSMASRSSTRRDSWMNVPKDASINHEQARQVRVDKQRKKQSSSMEVKKTKKLSEQIDVGSSLDGCPDDMSASKGRESPIYANSRAFAESYKSCSDKAETESFILEELTKAADEILRAVNGYTDDDSSFRGSSDDEPGKRYHKDRKLSSKPLGTISETPSRKEGTRVSSKSSVSSRQVRSTVVKSKLCKTSSNSSVEGEGSSADSKPLILEKPSKRRNVRLLQRASSREMLMKSRGAASSSEDVQSGSEQPVQQRVARTKTSRHSSHQKSTIASQSRTKEKVQKTVSSAENSSGKVQSTITSAASTRARHDARKRPTAKSKTGSTTVTGPRRVIAVGERLTPEGAEQQSRKETSERPIREEIGSRPRAINRHVSRQQASAVNKKKTPTSISQGLELTRK